MKRKDKKAEEMLPSSTNIRLDVIIRLLIEMNKSREKNMNEAIAARLLKSIGLKPTEIAKILGKKSATDVAPYLYPRKKRRAY